MSCEECEKAQDENRIIYIRHKNANIGILACKKHFLEIRQIFLDANKE